MSQNGKSLCEGSCVELEEEGGANSTAEALWQQPSIWCGAGSCKTTSFAEAQQSSHLSECCEHPAGVSPCLCTLAGFLSCVWQAVGSSMRPPARRRGVRAGSGLTARAGHHRDAHTACGACVWLELSDTS